MYLAVFAADSVIMHMHLICREISFPEALKYSIKTMIIKDFSGVEVDVQAPTRSSAVDER
jgi:hypothetical protein